MPHLSRIVALSLFVSLANAFGFSFSRPTQCDPLQIGWEGGQPPFQLLITGVFDNPQRITIPADAYDGTRGSYTVPELLLPASKRFMLTMSDAAGFGTGGTSSLLTVGSSLQAAPSCNTTSRDVDFSFELNQALQQCRSYLIEGFAGAAQPVTITGLIPLGTPFQLHPPSGATSFSWVANVRSETSIVFLMEDAQGRSGGSSDLRIVGASDDNTCINADSPSSTALSETSGPTTSVPASATTPAPTQSQSGSAVPAPPPPAPSQNAPKHPGAVIGGAIAGGVIALAAIGSLLIFLIRRHRARHDTNPYSVSARRHGSRRIHSVDLLPEARAAAASARHTPRDEFDPVPYVFPPPTAHSAPLTALPHSPTYAESVRTAPQSHHPDESPMSHRSYSTAGAMSKAQMAGSSAHGAPATRFVLHTDAGSVDEPDEEEIVELPPMYTDRRPQADTPQPPPPPASDNERR